METKFSDLLGKTITEIKGLEIGGDRVSFFCSDGTEYLMYHSQDCCESVSIDDINGDISDLISTKITLAEEVDSSSEKAKTYTSAGNTEPYYTDESFTWTFYKLATVNGYVDIKWYGSSNGYYSESVYFDLVNHSTED